ncbi:hypothetical protein GIB67_016882 [Kingdonia uniflora]|uniref:Dirigent protein n=1 Tax=Kingdonia uniflora TaxID=39325 RepID=A0A7J7M3I1_9MAGN|nr:hypothetical protein GIB67_016882 [Kingdonia uniflora]
MVMTRCQVYEVRVIVEVQKLQLCYFGNQSLKMPLMPVPQTYYGMTEEEAAEVEDDYYHMWRFHYLILLGTMAHYHYNLHHCDTMALILLKSPLTLAIFAIVAVNFIVTISAKQHSFARTLSPTTFGLEKEKLTHFRVYWQDILSGKSPTSMQIVAPLNKKPAGFGTVVMFDDALTEGPELNSKLIGRGQGLLASAAQNEIGLLMVMNFVFVTGKYNGSTISITGRNHVFSKVREMSIIGGSGLFRFARGYVQAQTHKFDLKTGDATVAYDIFVLHY